MKLLHIDASALGAHSVSRGLTQAIVSEFVNNHPGTEVTYRDLHAAPLAHWGLPAGEDDPNAAEAAKVMEEFLAADVVVIGAPMYNFGMPIQLKAWFDAIARAGVTFRYTEKGAEGLLKGKKVYVALARGGLYRNTPADTQVPYLKMVLGFLGMTDVRFVYAEGLAMGEDAERAGIASAWDQIEEVVAA